MSPSSAVALFKLIVVVFPLLGMDPYPDPGRDSLVIMFWNLENYFDWRRDTVLLNASEEEFTSFGRKHWTKRKFMRKSLAIAKTVLWIADGEGMLPDVIGVAEIENRFVLERLTKDTPLSKAGYGIIHYDSPDPRGIDVAMLYRKDRLKPRSSKPLRVEDRDDPEFHTRDILLAEFIGPGGDSLAVLVNHHPSKYGGGSSRRRETAMRRLKEATDSLTASGWRNIVSMGDFNDVPESTEEYSRTMVNLAIPLAGKGEGTIKYSGRWELIDMFFVSPSLAGAGAEMKIFRIPFLSVRDNAHSGEKPFRTYSGPGYSGGVSDHCPIVLKVVGEIRLFQ